jgi:hypothetical protein
MMTFRKALSVALGHRIPMVVLFGLAAAGSAAVVIGANTPAPAPMPTPECPRDMNHVDAGGHSTTLLNCPKPR